MAGGRSFRPRPRSARLLPAFALAAAVLALLPAAPAAAIHLSFVPADTLIAPGERAVVAVRLDEPLALRSIELTVAWNPDLLLSIGGEGGALFDAVSCYVFEDFSEPESGVWTGFSGIIGAECQTSGAGEIYRWEVEGLGCGVTSLTCTSARLFAPDGTEIEEPTILPRARLTVTDAQLTAVPARTAAARLELAPNPFNPRVAVTIPAGPAGPARLEVFDARGRRLAAVWEGTLDGTPATAVWEGRDERGRAMPSGTYLFRLRGPQGLTAIARGSLVR